MDKVIEMLFEESLAMFKTLHGIVEAQENDIKKLNKKLDALISFTESDIYAKPIVLTEGND